jgi:hypothetical protein
MFFICLDIIYGKWDLISHDCIAAVYFLDFRSLNEPYDQQDYNDAIK